MANDIENTLKEGKKDMEAALTHLQDELLKVRTGKASPYMLDGLFVEYYGVPTPLNQVANVSTPDGRTLMVQPWEKSMLGPVEQSIFAANLGLTPQNDGESIRINLPPLTEERRKTLVKQSHALGEDAKVSVRNARHKVMDVIKREVKEGYPEDAGKRKQNEIDKMTQEYYDKVDETVKAKEKDIMTI